MELLYWAAGIIAFLLATTWLLKKLFKVQTALKIISIVKTERFNKSLDGIARHERILNFLTDLGLILGFGALAIDYLYGRKKSKPVRIALFAASAVTLYFVLDYILVFDILSENSPLAAFNLVIRIFFALFGLSGLILAFLAAYSWYIIEGMMAGQQVCPGVAPLIPGLAIPKIGWVVPLHAWISFVIIMALHEGMHGVLMRKAKTRIKSVGVLLAGLIPIGAFVEPDEKQLAGKKDREQLRAYVAGPASNLYTSLIATVALSLALIFIVNPVFGPWVEEVRANSVTGVLITGAGQNIDLCGEMYENNAFGKLEEGQRILSVNGKDVNMLEDIFAQPGFGTALGNSSTIQYSGEAPVTIEVLQDGAVKEFEVAPNGLGMIRFNVQEEKNPDYVIPQGYLNFATAYSLAREFIFWFILLNFLVAIANLMPMEPFDGGKIVKIMLLPYFGFMGMDKAETQKLIGRLFLWIVGALLIINVVPLFI